MLDFELRFLLSSDYQNYLDIMFEFTNYRYEISFDEFQKQLDEMNNLHKIIVLIHNDKMIGVGSIFKLNKLHNNPVGQIEDVIITKEYRNKGLGRLIIKELINIGINKMGCYKIILNCLDHNVKFYEKCGFQKVGNEMKYIL